MKKAVSKYSLVIILLLSVSCNNKDGHSLGKFYVDIATAIPKEDNVYTLLLDNGKRLWVAHSDVKYIPKGKQRVFVNYTTLSDELSGYDHYVKVNGIWNILNKPIIVRTPENADSIGNDPAKINEMWIVNNYLNVDFMFNFGHNRPHAINLVSDISTNATSPDVIDLEFTHNAYNSTNSILHEGFVCFDLNSLRRADVDSVKISVKVRDWDEDKTYDLVYRYNQAALQNTIVETPIPVVSTNEYY